MRHPPNITLSDVVRQLSQQTQMNIECAQSREEMTSFVYLCYSTVYNCIVYTMCIHVSKVSIIIIIL